MTKLTFELAENTSKVLTPSVGEMENFTWTGFSESVEFHYSGSSGHIRLAKVKAEIGITDGIEELTTEPTEDAVWSLSGQRISGVVLVRNLGQLVDVNDVGVRVTEGLDVERLGVGTESSFDSSKVLRADNSIIGCSYHAQS